MRWAHSAVDYLAAAVGGDNGAGAGRGAVGERVVVNTHYAGTTGGNGPSHSTPPPDTHLSHRVPPTQSLGDAKPNGTGKGPGTLGGVRSGYNVTALMNTVCQPTCRGGGCPIPLTAATSLHVVTHNVISVHNNYSCMCV